MPGTVGVRDTQGEIRDEMLFVDAISVWKGSYYRLNNSPDFGDGCNAGSGKVRARGAVRRRRAMRGRQGEKREAEDRERDAESALPCPIHMHRCCVHWKGAPKARGAPTRGAAPPQVRPALCRSV